MRQQFITNLNMVTAAPIAYVPTNDMPSLDALTLGGLDYRMTAGTTTYGKWIDPRGNRIRE